MTAHSSARQFACPVRVRRIRTLLFCLLLVAPVTAQSPSVPVTPYTEIEQLRIQNAQLEGAIVQRAVQDWQAKVAKLKADLEAKRPNWEWSPDTGEWKPRPEKDQR